MWVWPSNTIRLQSQPSGFPARRRDNEYINNNLFLHQVKLTKFDDKQKVALIKEIKGLLEGYNLVQAKKFVESVPAVVKADVSKDEAEKLKEALSKVGGVIEIE